MKKVLIFLALVILDFVVFGDNAAIGAPVLLALIVIGIFMICRSFHKRRKAKKAQKAQAEPIQQAAPAQQPEPKKPETPKIDAADAHGDGIAYYYDAVGVYVPFVDVFERDDLTTGAIVTLRQEPTNKYDSGAVAVVLGRKRIGYLYRGRLQDMANDWLERGDSVSGRIVYFDPTTHDARKNGLKIDLYFYE